VEPSVPQVEPRPQSSPPSAATTPAPSWWPSYFVPSVADLIFVILLVTLSSGLMAMRLLGDAGTGWHIRNGQQILRTHLIPHTDPFSVSTAGRPWYAWEWMYDATIAAIHKQAGLNGVVFVSAALIAFTFAFLFRMMLQRGALLPVGLLLLILALISSSIHFFARPHVVSWLFTLVWFQILDSSEHRSGSKSARSLFWLPVLMLLWVNLHGGFVFAFALLGVYLLSATIEYFRSQGEARPRAAAGLRELGIVTALSLLASLANPYGYELHVHVYRYLSDRWLMNHIDEFLAPNFHGLAQQCFAALLLITIVTLALSRARVRLSNVLVLLLAGASGLYASRNLPVASILLALVIAPLLSQAVIASAASSDTPFQMRTMLSRCLAFASRVGAMEAGWRGHLWPIMTVLLGIAISLHQGKLGAVQLMDAHFDAKRFPVQAAEVIQERGMHDPIFTLDSWGGYLIYQLYPQSKVFVDDRHDLYGVEFFKQYLRTIRVEPEWDALLNDNHVNWVLVPKDSPLASALRTSLRWKVSYEDQTAVLFQRS
jgi:hypothetical protein